MTKSNKILLCTLLALVMTLACAITVLPVAKTTANAGMEDNYVLVTDASSLKVGDEILIVNSDFSMAISTTQSSNNRPGTEIAYDKSTGVVNIGSEVQTIVLENGKNAGTFAFAANGEYLYAASSTKNYLRTQPEIDDNSSWTIAIVEDGIATIKAQGTNTHNWLRYNDNNKLFSCYSEGQDDVKIFRMADSAPTSSASISLTGTLGAVEGSSKIEEVDGTDTLVLGADSTFDVVYAIASATDIWGTEATVTVDSNYLTIDKITAGAELAAADVVTISGDSETTKKIVATGDMTNFVGKTFVTVTYKLKNGATEVPTSAYGLTVKAVGKDGAFVADDKVTATVTEMPIKVVQTTKILVDNKVEYTGSALTVGKENSNITVVTDHTGEITATWVDSEGNALEDQNIVNAGSYKLELTFAASGVYAAQEETFDVTVTPAVLSNGKYAAKNGNATKYIVNGKAAVWDNADEFIVSFDGLKGTDKLEEIGALTIVTPVTLAEAGEELVELKFTITSGNYVFAENKKEDTDEVIVEAKVGGIEIQGKPEETTVYYGTTIGFDGLKAIDVTTSKAVEATFTLTIRNTLNGAIVETITGADVATYELVNAGEYYVDIKAVATDTSLGEIESVNNHYTINKLNLTQITLDYTTAGKVTWTAPKYYTDNANEAKELSELTGITVAFTYTVNGTAFAATEYVPTAVVDSLTIAVVCDNANFVLPEAVTTKAVVSVTFVDEKNDTETASSIAAQYRFVGQKATAPANPTFEGWTFKGWFATDAESDYDFATELTVSITLTAKWDENIVDCTLTVVNVYNGTADGKGETLKTAYAGKTNLDDVTDLVTIALKKFVKVAGYYSDENCTVEITLVPNQAKATIYAKYVLAITDGDVNGDGTFDNNDIVLYRQYIVGGYNIEVVAKGEEYESAVLYADNSETKLFFLATANVNGDTAEEKEVYDIRDAAVMAMAMVNAGGYGVEDGKLTKPATQAKASNVMQAKQYALLPVAGKFAV